jgi:1,2-dihydroxy-3-keto-5-methylthiopentene dioxygenase
MASISIPTQQRHIEDHAAVTAYLADAGLPYERWPVEGRIASGADANAVLAAYAPEIERLKRMGGYVTADVIDVSAQTPNLDAMLAKFDKEHSHAEDEVRFIIDGAGLFFIRPASGPVFAIQVGAGDLLRVPAGTRHWFTLCADRRIRAIRLFVDPGGWTPKYYDDGVHAQYAPVCWGPHYVSAQAAAVAPSQPPLR